MTRFTFALCAGLALAGCTDDGAAQISGQTTPWVAPLPAPIQLSWLEPGSDCLPVDYGCEQNVAFDVSSVTCDGCDVRFWDPGGFSPITADELITSRLGAFTVYAAPTTTGAISFSAELASVSGAHQTVSFSGTGDRVIGFAATCMQSDGSGTALVPCGATRAPTDEITLVISATTAGSGELPLSDLVQNATMADRLDTALPTMSPDTAHWAWGNTSIDPSTTALSETLRWTVGDTTLTTTVAIPPLAT